MQNNPLVELLTSLAPLELEAVTLLPGLRAATGEWFPTSLTAEARTQVIDATVELVAYTRRCAEMARRLSQVPPIPLRNVSLVEFGL